MIRKFPNRLAELFFVSRLPCLSAPLEAQLFTQRFGSFQGTCVYFSLFGPELLRGRGPPLICGNPACLVTHRRRVNVTWKKQRRDS